MTPKTITVEELTAALTTMDIHTGRSAFGGSLHVSKSTYPDSLARDLFREVEKQREPLYVNGTVYIDAYGEKWLYNAWAKQWSAFGSTYLHAFDLPKRPLRELVPAA